MGSLIEDELSVDFLVVGAGPAGASLAAFMAQNGLKGLVIARAPGTADTPRAHVFNPFALETLRDIGLEKDAMGHATHGGMFQSFRWARSMVGEEYGKVQAWGAHPSRMGDLARASPCEYLDLPQSYLEPILVRYASSKGFQFRFSTQLVNIREIPGSTDSLCTIRDRISQHEFQIRAKYVFGADGSRSKVAQLLGLKYLVEPQNGIACNVLFKADIGHLIPEERYAGLHSIIQPDNFHGMVPILRLIRPWNQWIFVCNFGDEESRFKGLTAQSPELVKMIQQAIGDDTVDVEIERLDPWNVNESVAESYSVEGRNIFILGDAAHRHPPAHANGSNTCVQDAYNLAWKVAYVAKGLAGPKLLESYSIERQPAGATLVREANQQLRVHVDVWKALGQFTATAEEGTRRLAELSEPTLAGDQRRQQLHDALEEKRRECENLGLSMNQWYTSSAVYLDDEKEARPALKGDPVVDILVSSYPGNRLPHAWVDLPTRRKLVSTHDLAGHGAFCLFIGHRGEAWREAAANITKRTGIPINTYGIGLGLDYIDVYRDWYKSREVGEDGCVLVRPDRFVAWRSKTMISDCDGKLQQVLDSILSRDSIQS
ncbi:putative phenol 2-monooxygenase [Rosellinia necatrix]|uniref:Putative phenol 2-monooxygenase n=1 Tax=Rosellinia necatrix TaxID=77044 RepID=A0A1W2TAD4_ROSNE|nr:putative phenol 2-monooxygenase [Rosellinia necatrix]